MKKELSKEVVSYFDAVCENGVQRKRLAAVWELEFRQPITKVDNCNIADVLLISQIYNVKPELKHNKEQMLRLYSSSPNYSKRKRLAAVWELEFRQPITKVDNCNIADVLLISQIYNVKPELKHNKEQMLRLYSSSPNYSKPNVACSQSP